MAATTTGDDYRIAITRSEKYRVARDGNPDNVLGCTAGCRTDEEAKRDEKAEKDSTEEGIK